MPRHPGVSPTTSTLSSTVFSDLVRRAARVIEGGTRVYPLHVGDTYREPLPAARAEMQRTADTPRLHNYADVQGERALLDAIERRLAARGGRAIPRERIQVMAGATAGLTVVCGALLDPGDEVVVPAPFWPLIRGIVAARGATPVEVPVFDRLADPSFDFEAAIERAITPRTAALYVNSPNNPTGAILSRDHVDAVARIAKRHDLWVLADEAYEELVFGDEWPAPIWARDDLASRTVATHTVSKSYGLAGARIGFTHGPAEAMAAIRGLQTFATYCAARPSQLGAARALDEGDGWLTEARAAYAEAARRSAEAVGVGAPPAGTFLFFDAAPFFRPAETLMTFLERCLEGGVLLTPGPSSGGAYATWVRLCFTSVPPDELDEALLRLKLALGR